MKWTKELCLEESKKYKSIKEFQENNEWVYNKSRINGWLSEMNLINDLKIKSAGYWTKEKCQEEALKYKSIKKLRINNSSVYSIAYRNNWLNEFFK